MKYDIYGRPETSPQFRMGVPEAYEQDIPKDGNDGVYYTRFYNTSVCAIHRITITTTGDRKTIVTEVAYGAWADRATLTYQEINAVLEV